MVAAGTNRFDIREGNSTLQKSTMGKTNCIDALPMSLHSAAAAAAAAVTAVTAASPAGRTPCGLLIFSFSIPGIAEAPLLGYL